MRPEPVGFYIDMMRYPFRHEGLLRGALHAVLLGISQCANAAGYFHGKRRHGNSESRDSWSARPHGS